ncbi:MAG: fibronectin type III domain-containing protein, partial [Bdellovibrionales bacterium]|nr:fibronectin type III domain-containing protein [Bdellovibrionales bacterium]
MRSNGWQRAVHAAAWLSRGTAAFALSLSVLSCVSSDELFDPEGVEAASQVDFVGCDTGHGVDEARIYVNLEPPAGATQQRIYRNGVLVGTTSGGADHYIDLGLAEGVTYEYRCEAVVKNRVVEGTGSVQLSTVTTQAPTFAGITAVTALDGRNLKVDWAVATGSVPVLGYRVYANQGTTVNWAAPPRQFVSNPAALSVTLTGLGDQLPYSVGVRACSSGPVCETNTVEQDIVMPDAGAPTSGALTAIEQRDGSVWLTVPWQESNGGIASRVVYVRTGAVGGTTLANYANLMSVPVPTITAPPTQIEVTGLLEATQYHFMVVDVDPGIGAQSTARTPLTLTTTDLTLPVFTGASSVVVGPAPETTIDVTFTPIVEETAPGVPSNGAKEYVAFTTSAPHPIVPGDPCSTGTVTKVVQAAVATSPITLTGLAPRTTYDVCLKARDAANNSSVTTTHHAFTTRDITAPQFDGLQSITFDQISGRVSLAWNPSSSPDVSVYSVKLWKNDDTPDVGIITTFPEPSSSSLGRTFSDIEFPFSIGDEVYAIVDACDDADSLPASAANCTDFGTATWKKVTIPDYTPPPGFTGIRPAGDLLTPAQGQITVRWNAPADWTDYRGFKVYQVGSGNSLLPLRDCRCSIEQTSCTVPANYEQCTVSGLAARRTYRLHVRAYDDAGNETPLDVVADSQDKTTIDDTPPVFASALTLGQAPDFALSWTAATDNQFAGEPGAVISYEIWRKEGSTFAAPTNPLLDGTLKGEVTGTTWVDPEKVELSTYFYTVCALDASGNRSCDGNVRQVDVPDVTPPVISSLTSNHGAKKKTWNLTWGVSDNFSAVGDIQVRVFRRASDPPAYATENDTLIASGPGLTAASPLGGPAGLRRWVNYLVEAVDEAGNRTLATFAVLSDNRITVTGVAGTVGPATGGKRIIVKGTGFSKAADNGYGTEPVVTVGGANCGSVRVYDSFRLTCVTPALGPGLKAVAVTNPEGSSATIANAYTVQNPALAVCDRPGDWGAQLAAGTGTPADPFIICTATHLNWLRKLFGESGAAYNYRSGGYYYRLGDNIDLEGSGFTPIPDGIVAPVVSVVLDGAGFGILNFAYANGSETHVGLFRRGYPQVQNIDLLGFDLTGSTQVGGVIGMAHSTPQTYSGIHVQARIRGGNKLGAIAGEVSGGPLNLSNITATVDVEANVSHYVGGLVGNGPVNLSNATVYGRVQGPGSYVAGAIGTVGGPNTIANVTSYVDVTCAGAGNCGGVLGDVTNSTLTNLSYYGTLTAVGPSNGGIVGALTGSSLTEARNYGTVNGSNYIGGVVGNLIWSMVTRAYNHGVLTSGFYQGGVIGKVLCSDVHQVANFGHSSGCTSECGGIAGRMDGNANASCTGVTNRLRESFSLGWITASAKVSPTVAEIFYNAGATAPMEVTDTFGNGYTQGTTTVGGLNAEIVNPTVYTTTFNRMYASGDFRSGSGNRWGVSRTGTG